jgi:hypothetical protein
VQSPGFARLIPPPKPTYTTPKTNKPKYHKKKSFKKNTFNNNAQKSFKKWHPLLDALIPELFVFLQSHPQFFRYKGTNTFCVTDTTTLHI